ncbi:hypothetical protein BFP72_17705 [Reichenbachiella sp. 5M10]|uniref:hypothetical protein n=1 Tax=Reichenbachiella sp. 5M10 TaxID=1889772 RepID=UPI000C15705D|nr:hypothetical protein [Reichenbachiella sp. 5M10]PIB37109.1 hypothetical protein BFP72_17705 [Reichenbachiella sp. 5M10]
MGKMKFMDLSLEDKIQHLYEHAQFVMDIRYYRFKINLFLLNGHYFEVFIAYKEVEITKIVPLDYESNRFGFYLDQVRLPKWANS